MVDLAADWSSVDEYWGENGALACALELESRVVDLTNDSSSDDEDTDAEDANAPECEFIVIIDLTASGLTDEEYWGDSEFICLFVCLFV